MSVNAAHFISLRLFLVSMNFVFPHNMCSLLLVLLILFYFLFLFFFLFPFFQTLSTAAAATDESRRVV